MKIDNHTCKIFNVLDLSLISNINQLNQLKQKGIRFFKIQPNSKTFQWAFFAGNLTENTTSMAISLAMFVPAVLGVLYIMIWQTYILRIEVVLSCVQLSMQGLQLIFAVICTISFYGGGSF